MLAETAGGAPVTDAPESTDVQTDPAEASHREAATEEATGEATEESSAAEIAGSDRLKAILEEEGLPAEEIEEATKPKGKSNAEKTETPGSDQTSETTGDRPGAKSAREEDKGPKPEGGGKKSEVGSRKSEGKAEDDEDAPLTEEQKQAAPWALPRIHKVTAQREAARAEAKQLREQLQRVSSAQRPVPTAEEPLADVETPEQMHAAVAEYESLLEWAETNPDGLTDVEVGKNADGTPKTRDYSAQEMATIRAKAGRILRQEVPRRVAYLRERQLHEEVIKERMPTMLEEGTDENRFFRQAYSSDPRQEPGYPNMIRWAWMGRKLDMEASKSEVGSGKSEVKNGKTVDSKVAPFLRKHPPLAPGSPEARVQGNGGPRKGDGKGSDEAVTQAKQRVEAGEGEEAEVDLIESLRGSQASKKGAVLV